MTEVRRMLRHRSSWPHLVVLALATGLVLVFVTAASGRTDPQSASPSTPAGASADPTGGTGSAASAAASAGGTARLLVKFKSSTPSDQQSNAVSAAGAKELGAIADLAVKGV